MLFHRRVVLPSFRLTVVVICGAAILSLIGCERGEDLAPPAIRYGEHECIVCRMIISDERFAAAAIALDARGRHDPLIFDDIGCLFEYEAAHPDAPLLARYVRHRSADTWLDAEKAEYVHSRDIHTPMAFGLAAMATLDEARALQKEVGGEFITLDEARRRFDLGTLHVSVLDPDAQPFITSLQSENVIVLDDGRELRLSLMMPQVLPPDLHAFEIVVERAISNAWRAESKLELMIEPEMPSMGHGSPGNEHPVHVEQGHYLGKVNFTMAGYWLVHVEVLADGRPIGRTSFAFEVKR